jgi:hypothetical protein
MNKPLDHTAMKAEVDAQDAAERHQCRDCHWYKRVNIHHGRCMFKSWPITLPSGKGGIANPWVKRAWSCEDWNFESEHIRPPYNYNKPIHGKQARPVIPAAQMRDEVKK